MPIAPLPNNYICLTTYSIVLGKSISNFFQKRNINSVLLVADNKTKNLIFWGIDKNKNDTQNKSTGYRIIYSGNINTCTSVMCKISHIFNMDELRQTRFKARPLNSHSIIVENMPIKNIIAAPGLLVNLKDEYMILGHMTKENMTKETMQQSISLESIRHTKPQTSSNPPETQNNAATGLEIDSGVHITPFKERVTQTAYAKKVALYKEKQVNDPYNAQEQEQADTIKADGEYKRMILGE